MFDNQPVYRNAIESLAAEIPVSGGKILVTGASGLIGICLIDVLIAANEKFGKKFEIFANGRNKEKLMSCFSYSGLHIIAQDITQPFHLEDIEYIVHAASNADPRSYALYPAETILTNILGTKNVLDCGKKNGSRVLLTSSFEVYGNFGKDVYSETDYGSVDLDLLRSCYPESKRTAEMLCRAYHDEYSVDTVIARLSSIYGPTMKENDSKAHAQFLRNAVNGEKIVLKSAGTQKRTYCYVMDAVSGILFLLFFGKSGEAYNVANENAIASIAEIAHQIADLSGIDVVFDHPDAIEQKGFSRPQNCILDTKKIRNLGWSGKYDLRQGLEETLAILHHK